ncbi:unnamed protein product [Gongylonema pulchrum]|uniref:Amino_oxidase domain-containing protein n=1 Tax=Gongylonema pulchrum TaxID=637853 RepID=A0A183EYA9_9BILA|nr:unnamed protein product [Gongylonema pulchrum]
MGSSVAYWIKQTFRDEDYKVVVVENNDKLKMLGFYVVRNRGTFWKDNDPPDVHFLPMSFMYLACTPEDVERLKRNWKVQTLVAINFFFLPISSTIF